MKSLLFALFLYVCQGGVLLVRRPAGHEIRIFLDGGADRRIGVSRQLAPLGWWRCGARAGVRPAAVAARPAPLSRGRCRAGRFDRRGERQSGQSPDMWASAKDTLSGFCYLVIDPGGGKTARS
jgi:hypothetical protein